MVAVDEKTIDYLRGRPQAPQGEMFEKAAAYWKTLVSDPGAPFDKVVEIDSTKLKPQVTWGTSPEMVVSIEDRVPDPDREKDPVKREAMERALTYMGLEPNTPDDRDQRRQDLHRLVHQFADRGSARGRPRW
jgi:3-isopropylmalate/(R)-2-methylmalate dehydratase large subunit